jgi:hypothetical protein
MPSGCQPRSDLWSLRCQGERLAKSAGLPGHFMPAAAPRRCGASWDCPVGSSFAPLFVALCLFRPASAYLPGAGGAFATRAIRKTAGVCNHGKRRSTLNRLAGQNVIVCGAFEAAPVDRNGPSPRAMRDSHERLRRLAGGDAVLSPQTAGTMLESDGAPDNTLSGGSVSVAFSTRHLLIRHYIRAAAETIYVSSDYPAS